MKRVFYLLTFTLISFTLFAQAPQKMSFQAIVRNDADELVSNTTVGMRISILQTSSVGTAVYVETHTPQTNTNGLVSIEIGAGVPVSGTFSGISWGNDSYFIKTETDPEGGTNYTITGTSQLLSVPYALYAGNSSTINPGETPGEMLYWTGSAWELVKIGGKGQILTFCKGLPTWTWGGICRDDTIGDPGQAGGIIFYDKGFYSDGWRYLEAGPVDISTDAEWGCRETDINGTLRDIGSGDVNTTLIINSCPTPGIAAGLCADYSVNGFSDWYLPSRDELYLMWINLDLQGLGSFVDDDYWSSTQFVSTQAWSYDFFHGDNHNLDKAIGKNVRPVRKF